MEYVAAGDVGADGVQMLSTGGMIGYAETAKAEGSKRDVIVATEVGMLYPLQQAAPDVNFIPANAEASCRYMKMITLEKLRDGSGEVKVEPAIAELARVPIERMVSINP
jgi:quinolinate synthase